MKILLRILLVVAAVALLSVLTLPLYVDSVVEAAIERGGSHALGVDTTVGNTDIGLFSGDLALADLEVANPPGFSAERFLSLAEGAASISPGSLLSNEVHVSKLRLTGGRLNLERDLSKANYRVILDNLKSEEQSEKQEAADTGYVVEHVVLEDLEVGVSLLGGAGGLTETTVPIERLELHDIGSETNGGVLMARLSGVLLEAILRAVVDSGVDLPGEVLEELKTGLAGLGSLAGQGISFSAEVGGALGGAVKEAGEAAGDAASEALQEIGGVLGGESDSDEGGRNAEGGSGSDG